MKKLLFLLFFIPLLSFGQTYEDLISIDSKEQFQRVMIENNYQTDDDYYDETGIRYDLNPTNDGDFTARAYFYFKDKILVYEDSRFALYENIYKKVKEKCTFKDVGNPFDGGIDFAFYKCPDNKLEKRKIGFTPLGEGQLSENEVTYGIMIIPSNVTLYKFGAHK